MAESTPPPTTTVLAWTGLCLSYDRPFAMARFFGSISCYHQYPVHVLLAASQARFPGKLCARVLNHFYKALV